MRFSSLPFAPWARRSSPFTSLAMAAALLTVPAAPAQDTTAQNVGQSSSSTQTAPAAQGAPETQDTQDAGTAPAKPHHHWIERDDSRSRAKADTTGSPDTSPAKAPKPEKVHVDKADRVVQSKDTRAELRREQKFNPLAGKDANLPDKALYDKALAEEKKGHYDVARLDLQTLLNTYPESQYLMRAKLAVANSWFSEGGSAAMAQAEQEFGDFITFFPNAPEAAEAQMRMGDIYMKQMDVPDRDYANALKAEEQYRVMLKTYPDAPPAVKKQAEQDLRDVQEVLAQREFELGQFYALRGNQPAAIARYQTVADTYPLYSHMDETLIGLGDAYEADANAVRSQQTCTTAGQFGCLPEAAKARLLQRFDDKAAAYYRDVVLNHAAAPHVEDAKERLQSMGLPLPVPTPQQVAASDALEGSRAQYTLQRRLQLLLVRKPDTVTAAEVGAPPLDDAAPTVAPTVRQAILDDFKVAEDPAAVREVATRAPTATEVNGSASPVQPTDVPGKATLTLSDPATATGASAADSGTVTEVEPAPDAATPTAGSSVGTGGASLGAEVLSPGASTTEPAGTSGNGNVAPGTMTGAPVTGLASDLPAATGKPDPNYGLVAPKPASTAVAPPVQAPETAPEQVNEAAGLKQAQAPPPDPDAKKKPKPAYDKNDESSSKHHKKKGLDKLNPF